jgi:hypothetical protein
MEPLTLFAYGVGFIGAFHLVSQTVERLGKGIYNNGNREGKRTDWYCFFQPSDLFGNQTDSRENIQPSETEQLEQRRRQQANRPRLRA